MRLRWPGLLALCILAAPAGPALACDVPVHQYALNNWSRDLYHVYYVHTGAVDPADEPANAVLRAASDDTSAANLSFASVNAKGSLPEELARVWDAVGEAALPAHVILSPRGLPLAVERLTEAEARALVDSPGRQALAKALCGPQMGTLLLLADRSEASEEARNTARLIAVREVGGCGFVEVRRDAPEERWLVRQLLSLEEDLSAITGPMVFAVFGRGHAMEPCLGRGITGENMAALAAFMAGPCTCEVKEEHLGMDLLTRWDWEKYADPNAAQDRSTDPAGFVTIDE